MPDPTPLSEDWFGRGLSGLLVGALVFVAKFIGDRRTAKSSSDETLSNNLNSRLSTFMRAQEHRVQEMEGEIADLRRQMAAERQECDRKLQSMQAEIDRLMANPLNQPAPSYTGAHAARAQRIGRAAQARQANKGKPDASDS